MALKKAKKVKSKILDSQRKSAKLLEAEIVEKDLPEIVDDKGESEHEEHEEHIEHIEHEEKVEVKEKSGHRDMLEQIMFKLPYVIEPLVGTPKQVQRELDTLVKKMQKNSEDDPENDKIFDKIHLYIHMYLINLVLKKFPFIKGYQTVDIYQETLIALRFKAIPGFKKRKGMSFLNFAKMCIRRHLITLLNVSRTRKKDQSMNQAISLDSSPSRQDDDDKTTYANIIPDKKPFASQTVESNEAYKVTKKTLFDALSEFERTVLNEYLAGSSYRDVSKNITIILKQKYNTKSIDNALLRIRKKAAHLYKYSKTEELPIFTRKKDRTFYSRKKSK